MNVRKAVKSDFFHLIFYSEYSILFHVHVLINFKTLKIIKLNNQWILHSLQFKSDELGLVCVNPL